MSTPDIKSDAKVDAYPESTEELYILKGACLSSYSPLVVKCFFVFFSSDGMSTTSVQSFSDCISVMSNPAVESKEIAPL